LNGDPIAFATNSSYTSTALVNLDQIHVVINNPAPCAGNANSNIITINVTDLPTASVSASLSSVCKDANEPTVTFIGLMV